MISNDFTSSSWHEKNELEKTLLTGIHGAPELKANEKKKYLGVFREQVMAFLTEQQIREPAIYTEVAQALKDSRADMLILNGIINRVFSKKYESLADTLNKPVKIVVGSEYNPATGLVVASSSAVNLEKVELEPRSVRLRKLGLEEDLINSAGKKICQECFEKILSKAPDEKTNYRELGLIDRIAGDTCPAHKGS